MWSTQTFASSLGYNLGGQFIARIISFAANIYLLRTVDGELLGVVNVRLTLFYTAILFLVREPFRKACLSYDGAVPRLINLLWLRHSPYSPLDFSSPLLAACLACALSVLWLHAASQPSATLVPSYSASLWLFGLSAVIESLAEPFWVISQRLQLVGHVALAQTLLVFLQRVLVLLLMLGFPKIAHIDAFCYAQVLSSCVYLAVHISRFASLLLRHDSVISSGFGSWRAFLPRPAHGLDPSSSRLVASFFLHSLLKQLLTDGAGYVMTFTRTLTFTQQAVYDAIERLGSLAARIVLAPLEETSYVYFSTNLQRDVSILQQDQVHTWGYRVHHSQNRLNDVKRVFTGLLHFTTVLGLIVCVFGAPYSKLAVTLYGGSLLSENSGTIPREGGKPIAGALLLSLYCGYMLVLAVNGITECLAIATMNDAQVLRHGRFLLVAAVVHFVAHAGLSLQFAAAGFIIANAVNMIIRIVYSLSQIDSQTRWRSSAIAAMIPPLSLLVLLGFSLAVTTLSNLLFGAELGLLHPIAHVAVGLVMLLLVSLHVWQSDVVLADFLQRNLPHLRQKRNL